jgi:hypothetical protein
VSTSRGDRTLLEKLELRTYETDLARRAQVERRRRRIRALKIEVEPPVTEIPDSDKAE